MKNNIFQRLKPIIVLCIITTVMSGLLILSSLFIPDTSGIITETLNKSCISLLGEGEYEIIDDWSNAGYKIAKPDNVNKLIAKKGGDKSSPLCFEVTTKGFKPPDGITALVAVDENGIIGVEIVKVNDDPGIGDRVKNEDFLARFIKKNSRITLSKSEPKSEDEVMGITGATYSSNGVVDAVNIALETYKQMF